MDSKEAKRLKISERVQIWAASPDACTGTVIETGYNAIKIRWDDGHVVAVHLEEMKNVRRYHGNTPIIPVPKAG
jgi:hypothetical protein